MLCRHVVNGDWYCTFDSHHESSDRCHFMHNDLILMQACTKLPVALSWLQQLCLTHMMQSVMLSNVHGGIWTLNNLRLFVDHRQKDSSSAAPQSATAA